MNHFEKILDGVSSGFVDIRKFTDDEIIQIIIDAIEINPFLTLVVTLLHNNMFTIKELLEEENKRNGDMRTALLKIKEAYPTFFNDLAFLSFCMVLLKVTEFLKNQEGGK